MSVSISSSNDTSDRRDDCPLQHGLEPRSFLQIGGLFSLPKPFEKSLCDFREATYRARRPSRMLASGYGTGHTFSPNRSNVGGCGFLMEP
jgi:hypothetical protein